MFGEGACGLAARFGIWGGEADAEAVFIDFEAEATMTVIVCDFAEFRVFLGILFSYASLTLCHG